MNSTQKITVRLPSDTIILLQSLVNNGDYQSMMEVVQEAIFEFIDNKFSPEEKAEIIASPPTKTIDIASLMKDGDATTLDEAVRKAVSEYVRERMDSEE